MNGSSQMLARLLRHEVNVGSLIGYLVERDPSPLQGFLDLNVPIVSARVEVPYGVRSRMDVVLDGKDGPIAVLELKVAATEHGDQLARYMEYAKEHRARTVIADLEIAGLGNTPEGWTRVGLDDLFGCWTSSAHPAVSGFGREVACVFRDWRAQIDGPMGGMDSVVFSLMIRAIAADLTGAGLVAHAGTTSGGQPMLTVFAPHPSGIERAYFCVDIRCQNKNDSSLPWLVRIGVQVDAGDDLASDRRTAHQLAMGIKPALSLDALRGACADARIGAVGDALTAERAVKTPRDQDGKIEQWLKAVDRAVSGKVPSHPVFYHDWGRRLAAQFLLDVTHVSRQDLTSLVTQGLKHLHGARNEGRILR